MHGLVARVRRVVKRWLCMFAAVLLAWQSACCRKTGAGAGRVGVMQVPAKGSTSEGRDSHILESKDSVAATKVQSLLHTRVMPQVACAEGECCNSNRVARYCCSMRTRG